MNEAREYEFRKYEHMGAYHWLQADPAWSNSSYNAPLVARYDVMMSHIPPTAQTVLDVGCGDGYLIHLLHQSGFSSVVGVDNNSLAVRLAKDKLRNHDHITSRHLCISSIYNLPLSAHSFDCVVMADVIEHLDNPEKALEEICRVLTNNGVLVLSTPIRQPDRIWDRYHVQEFHPEELGTLLSPFFKGVSMVGCWPMWCFRLWARGRIWRYLVYPFARFGLNPFAISTNRVSEEYGQLVAVCQR